MEQVLFSVGFPKHIICIYCKCFIISIIAIVAFYCSLIALGRTMETSRSRNPLLGCGCLLMLVIGGCGVQGCYVYGTGGSVTTTVNGVGTKVKEKKNSDGHVTGTKDVYMIYTADGTFRNEDCWMRWKFTSSDVHSTALQAEKTQEKVTIHYYGWRWGFFSWYPNVYKIE